MVFRQNARGGIEEKFNGILFSHLARTRRSGIRFVIDADPDFRIPLLPDDRTYRGLSAGSGGLNSGLP